MKRTLSPLVCRLPLVFVAWAWLCVLPAAADETVFPLKEPAFPAKLARIDQEWNLHFRSAATSAVRVIAAGDLAYWGRCRDLAAGRLVVLRDGGLLRADVLKLADSEVVIGDATELGRGLWDESSLPRSAISAIVIQPPAGKAELDALLARLQHLEGESDVLLLSSGEELPGRLIAAPLAGRFAAEGEAANRDVVQIVLPGNAEPLTVAAAKVVAIRLAGIPESAAAEPQAWLGFEDGSLVAAQSLQTSGGVGTIALARGGKLVTQPLAGDGLWESVRYVEPVNERVAWLSDLEPLGYVHIPFLSAERTYGRDRSVLGSRLRGADAVWRKGLGMPSASRLAYDVAGFRHFAAELAIDARAELAGSVACKVLLQRAGGEWQVAYESPVVRGGQAPIPVRIDLEGADRLALLVEFADRGDASDYANWLSARLVK